MLIETHKNFFLERCFERHYSIEEVSECIVSKNGEMWTIDTEHPKYPKYTKNIEKIVQNMQNGAGTELKKMLELFGIKSSENCSCQAKAKIMNHMGIEWCKDNIDTIVTWLKEEAEKRHLPFSSIVAKKIVQIAISRAEKEAKHASSSR